MNIFGIGIDVVEVERVESSLAEFGERFTSKLFTAEEINYCSQQKRPSIHYAARFAAKEAVAKAFGTGIGKDLGWLDMEIRRRATGEPEVFLSGPGAAEANKITEIKISLTHAHHYAAANAIVLAAS